jgi:predicted dehydrogenase
VAITTPVPTHGDLAIRALEAGKHCFVEKPLAQDAALAERIVALASERDLTLMVGHLLCYHPGVRQLADLIEKGDLGDVYYLYSQRLNLGKLRADENALWSLGAHDVSVLLELADGHPSEVTARGEAYVRDGVEDVVFAYIRFDSGLAAHLHLSWLDPHKERRLTVVGSERMATLDDMALERKLTIYDKGFDPAADTYGEYITRSGAVVSPAIPNDEPLRLECQHFIDCLADGSTPRTDGAAGLQVVQVLEALQASLDSGGAPQPVGAAVGA